MLVIDDALSIDAEARSHASNFATLSLSKGAPAAAPHCLDEALKTDETRIPKDASTLRRAQAGRLSMARAGWGHRHTKTPANIASCVESLEAEGFIPQDHNPRPGAHDRRLHNCRRSPPRTTPMAT